MIFARELSVRDYRNFASYTLELAEGVTILVGRNAVGKTNLVEALQLLTSGASFRRPAPAELVAEGETSCKLALRLEGEGRVIDLGCAVREGKRSFSRNGKKCRAAGVRGVVPQRLLKPEGEAQSVQVMFRPAGVYENATLCVMDGDREILRQRKRILTPGEMAELTLKPEQIASLSGADVTVCVKQ